MAQIKVTQIKSAIGTKPNQRQTLRSLGLKRIHDSVVQEDRPEIRGMVATVPHLVTVEERSEEHTSELQSRQYLVCRLLLEKKKTAHISTAHSCTINLKIT